MIINNVFYFNLLQQENGKKVNMVVDMVVNAVTDAVVNAVINANMIRLIVLLCYKTSIIYYYIINKCEHKKNYIYSGRSSDPCR